MPKSGGLDPAGVRSAVLAYGSWGLVPLFWKLLVAVPSFELMLHRILWSWWFYLLFILWRKKDFRFLRELGRSDWFSLVMSGSLISINWYVFVFAVNSGRVLQASLAYFLTPLMNVGLGLLIFGEKLSKLLKWALGFAAIGVGLLFFESSEAPYLALIMASTFSIYGMLKKKMRTAPLESAWAEMLFPLPIALLLAGWLRMNSSDSIAELDWGLMVLSGVVTGLPLIWFADAAQRLPYTTLGFFQFIPPTTSFLLAVLIYHEPFGWVHLVAFGLIWAGVGLYMASLLSKQAKQSSAPKYKSQSKSPANDS